ncbi:transposable element Tcb2 transposase [Trichonephila clavipes]|nr:transposable element Tcb2 transposase [Trichonephila clavipes]
MSQRSHVTDSEAWRVVGRLEGGQTQAEVAQAIRVSHNESRFSVHPDNRRIFIWRDRGSRSNPAFVHESVRFGGGGVLVYGGISIDGRTDLYIIRDVPLTARRHMDEIIRPILVPYSAAIGDDIILMDDNCWPHRANLDEDFLFEEGIVRMEWPACSPDMIEHVWDALGRRAAGRQPPPKTLQELERALLEEWDRIPQLVIDSLIDSMPQSPDLTPSDFNLFLHLKSFLAGKHFNNDKELKENVSNWLKTQAATFYEEGIEKLVPRYDTCPQNFGSYVESAQKATVSRSRKVTGSSPDALKTRHHLGRLMHITAVSDLKSSIWLGGDVSKEGILSSVIFVP